jgi:hypothetical protein
MKVHLAIEDISHLRLILGCSIESERWRKIALYVAEGTIIIAQPVDACYSQYLEI